jgi:predicted membrane-bound spermidine synthase
VGGALAAGLVAAVLLFPDPATLWTRLLGYASPAGAFVAEDASGVAVLRDDGERSILFVDGIEQGEVPFLDIHATLGIIPSLTHPNPQQALMIGIGSAGTPFGVGANPSIARIVAVELVGAEIPVLRQHAETFPDSPLRAFFDDPRVEIVVGDGRRVLAQSPVKFDIIEADPLYPWRSHAGMLYSREYFESARAQLAEGGLMAQWLPTPRAQATFMSVFPYGVDVGTNVLLGSNQPIDYNPQRILDRLQEPAIVEYLERGQVDVDAIRALVQTGTPRLWTPESARNESDINTDLFPKDEYYLNVALP